MYSKTIKSTAKLAGITVRTSETEKAATVSDPSKLADIKV